MPLFPVLAPPQFRPFLAIAILVTVGATFCAAQDPRPEAKLDAWVMKNTGSGRVAEFLVLLADQADLGAASGLATKSEKGRFVRDALWNTAQETQGPILAWLRERGLDHRAYYIVNMIRVTGGRADALALAARPDVRLVEGNPLAPGLVAARFAPEAPGPVLPSIEPGVAYTNAPAVWAMGYTGQGVVIGGQDTGYQWNHPAIVGKYRGWNGTAANHDYNWHDSIHSGGGSCGANNPAPCDDNAHGTHTMGTACGDDGAGNQIGMAPGAQWIGSRDMDQGNGTPATYIESFEFFLAPYPVAGTPAQGNPALAPDVTTNSWLCPPSEGCSAASLLLACQAQRAAGIMSIFAAGNSGSSCSTVNWPPAIYAEVTSVGALQNGTDNIASFSSRGPVTVDGSNRRKPDIAAPGTGVRSCVPTNGYAGGWSGTSMATPHVAGAVALLFSAHPALKGNIAATEAVLQDTAVHVSSSSCGSSGWPNNVYGYGRLDVLAAVNAVYSATLTPASSPVSGAVGTSVNVALTLTNTGYVADTYNLAVTGGTFAAGVSPATVGPVPAGGTAQVTVTVQVPPGAAFGSSSASTVTATSQAWAAAAPQAQVTTTATPVVPVLALSQPGGPGAGVVIDDTNLVAGHEYYNIFSGELCAGTPGSGPYLGLCALDPTPLISQFLVPVGVIPFHFSAASASSSFGPFSIPPGITVDGVCFDLTANQLGGVSAVVRYSIQ